MSGAPEVDVQLYIDMLQELRQAANNLARDDRDNEELGVKRWPDEMRNYPAHLSCGLLRRVLAARSAHTDGEGAG